MGFDEHGGPSAGRWRVPPQEKKKKEKVQVFLVCVSSSALQYELYPPPNRQRGLREHKKVASGTFLKGSEGRRAKRGGDSRPFVQFPSSPTTTTGHALSIRPLSPFSFPLWTPLFLFALTLTFFQDCVGSVSLNSAIEAHKRMEESEEGVFDSRTALLDELVRRRWVYSNGTQLHVGEAKCGALTGECYIKGSAESINFQGVYESSRNGARITITGLPAYILDPMVSDKTLSADKALELQRYGPQIELEGTIGIRNEICASSPRSSSLTLETSVSTLQITRRARSRSHTPMTNSRILELSPSHSGPATPGSAKHRTRCVSKDAILQQTPSRMVTWAEIDDRVLSLSSDSTDSTCTDL